MTAAAVLALIASGQQIPGPMDMDIAPPDLNEFDDLLLDKDAYDDQEAYEHSSHFAPQVASGDGLETRLDDYDHDLRNATATEGVASTDNSPDAHSSGRTSGEGPLVALTVSGRTDGQGVRISEPESCGEIDEELALVGGQDLGAIPVVAATSACNPAVRDAAQRRVPGPTGERVDLWQSGLGENDVAGCVGRSTCSPRKVGAIHDLPDVSSGTAKSQTRSANGTLDQEAEQVRSVDHRRPGICATESRGDGSPVHAAVRALRARKRSLELESTVQQMGTDLQRPDDDRGCDRPLDTSLRNHRAEDQELSTGRSQIEINSTFTWLGGYQTSNLSFTSTREF